MAIEILKTLEIIEAMENFLTKKRPPEHIRPKVDIGYKIEGYSIIIFEIRPQWNNEKVHLDSPIAKATFIKKKNHWKVFWLRADLKWHRYPPNPIVKTVAEFTKLVEGDKNSCFWG